MSFYLQKILGEKERIDCEHVAACAKYGCDCRRCRAARKAFGIKSKEIKKWVDNSQTTA